VSVFRFTLGSEAADRQAARFVGGFGAFLLFLNRLETPESSLTDAQRRAEGVGALLCASCVFCPAVDGRLRDLRRTGTRAPVLRGATNAFVLDRDVDKDVPWTKEVAWCTYATLRCTEARGVLVGVDGRAVIARGSLRESTSTSDEADRLGEATTTLVEAWRWRGDRTKEAYVSDVSSLRRVGAYDWPSVPSGATSLWVSGSRCQEDVSETKEREGDASKDASWMDLRGVVLLVYSDVPFPPKQRLWLSRLVEKLHSSWCVEATT